MSSDHATLWYQLHCHCEKAAAEAVNVLFEHHNALSITEQDAEDKPILEPLPGEQPRWAKLIVTALFDDLEQAEICQQAFAAMKDDGLISRIELTPLEDQVWERAWMDDYQPMAFGQRLWIYPSTHSIPDDDIVAIKLDPGLAFGTGTHPTTALCLRWLDAQAPADQTVLDFGCGSGILAIAALKLGASHADAVDIDPQAIEATHSNCSNNQVDAARIACYENAQYPETPEKYDLLMANILAPPLIELAEDFAGRCKKGADIILSGILEEQQESILAAYSPYFEQLNVSTDGGWCLVTGKRIG